MLKIDDGLHLNLSRIDGYNKDFNFIISPREDGKSTTLYRRWYATYKKYKSCFVYLMRNVVDISSGSIDKVVKTLREYCNEDLKVSYKESDFKTGFVDVVNKDTKELLFKVVALSVKTKRLKDLAIPNCSMFLMDEAIIDTLHTDEKYLKGEALKIREFYNTIFRDNKGDNGKPRLKCYFLGNPYSLYHPILVDWGVNTNELVIKGEPDEWKIQTGEVWLVCRKTLSKGLYDKILKENPGYKLSASCDYMDYALRGLATADNNFNLEPKKPQGFFIKYIVKVDFRYIAIWENSNYMDRNFRFYCSYVSDVGKDRSIFAFDFDKMVEGSVLFSSTDKMKFAHIRMAIRNRTIKYQSIEIGYAMQEIYNFL